MCFFLVLTGSMSLWHFEVQVISVHRGDVNLSVFQSQDIFQLLLPQQSLPSQCLWRPSWIQQALQPQQDFPKTHCSPVPILFFQSSLSLKACLKGGASAWHFQTWAERNLWLFCFCFCLILSRDRTFFYFECRARVMQLGNLSWCWSHAHSGETLRL